MADRISMLSEAARRGLLPPEKLEMFQEAQRRGLVPQAGVPGGVDGEIQPPPAQQHQKRFGDDTLKPIFGGSNPITDIYDVAAPALDPSSNRPLAERAIDSVNFMASAPLQALRLPTFGQMAEGVIGPNSLRQSEERFVENNPDLLQGLGALGEVAPGLTRGMGQGAPQPGAMASQAARQTRDAATPRPAIARQISDDSQRAIRATEDMEAVGVTPFGPAVAAAKRGDNSAGALTQALADKPLVGAPLQRGARQFVDETADAFENVRREFGADADIQTAGGRIKAAVDGSRSSRDIDVKTMTVDELQQVASRPVRDEGYRNVQSALYEISERLMPEGKLGRKPVGEGHTRDMALPGHTQQVLLDIKNRKGGTINKSAAPKNKKKNGDEAYKVGDLDDIRNPSWTNFRDLNDSLNVLADSTNWRAGIAGMREIRSMVRRAKAGMKGDSEVRALAKGDLKRLERAVTQDLYGLFERVIADETAAGRAQVASQYRASFDAMKKADGFTRHYETQVFGPLRRILHDDITPANAAGEILSAMRDGTRGNIEKLAALGRALPREQIDEFASAALRELARPRKGAGSATQESGFSVAKFVSEWNDLNPRARRLIFGRDPVRMRRLEALVRVASGLKDFERLANNSRTGVSNAVVGAAAGGAYGLSMLSPSVLAAVTGTLVVGWGTSKYLASPAYVRWLTRAREIERKSPQAQRAHVQRLMRLLEADDSLHPRAAAGLREMAQDALSQMPQADTDQRRTQ